MKYHKVVCKCGRKANLWDNVVDAWQKNDHNHYEHKCHCGNHNVVKIKIEKE